MVVEAGSLPGHPGEHPRVDVLVLVDQLVAALIAVDADERLPDVRSLEDVAGELLELVGLSGGRRAGGGHRGTRAPA